MSRDRLLSSRAAQRSAGLAPGCASRLNIRAGITLLEVIVSMAIFLFSIVFISQLVSIGSARALDVELHAKASILCQSKLAELMIGAEEIASVSSTAFKDEPEWQYEIEASDADAPGLKKVKVAVRQERPDGRSIEVILSRLILDPAVRGTTFDKLGGGTMP
jgi:type II secretion system protein I